MKKLILIALAVLLCGTAQAQQLKIATIAPENSDWVKGMRAGMAEIKERTEGRVTIKLFSGGMIPVYNIVIAFKVGAGLFTIFMALVFIRVLIKKED